MYNIILYISQTESNYKPENKPGYLLDSPSPICCLWPQLATILQNHPDRSLGNAEGNLDGIPYRNEPIFETIMLFGPVLHAKNHS